MAKRIWQSVQTDGTTESTEQVTDTETAETASSSISTSSGSSSSGSSNSKSSSSSSSGSSSSSSKSTHTHSYSAKTTKEVTCGSTGVKTYTCSCGASYTETIPATGNHTWVESTTTQDVYETKEVTRCSSCNVDMSSWTQEEVDAHTKAHLLAGDPYGGGYYCRGESVKVGTETVVTGYKCSVCGATK